MLITCLRLRFGHLLFSPSINEAYSQDFDTVGGRISFVDWPLANLYNTTWPCLVGELPFSHCFLIILHIHFHHFTHALLLTLRVLLLQLPIYFIVSLGCYGLLMVGIGLMTFPTCPREGLLLQKVLLPFYSHALSYHTINGPSFCLISPFLWNVL